MFMISGTVAALAGALNRGWVSIMLLADRGSDNLYNPSASSMPSELHKRQFSFLHFLQKSRDDSTLT